MPRGTEHEPAKTYTPRMHPHDLRALVAAITSIQDYQPYREPGCEARIVTDTDSLLAELDRTAKPEPQEHHAATRERERIISHICNTWTAEWFTYQLPSDIAENLDPRSSKHRPDGCYPEDGLCV